MMAATIQDFAPNVNIMPFGMCTTLSNPQVAAATSAALGVLTPQPCIPVTTSPWSPGSATVQINGAPALTATSMCQCAWGGVDHDLQSRADADADGLALAAGLVSAARSGGSSFCE